MIIEIDKVELHESYTFGKSTIKKHGKTRGPCSPDFKILYFTDCNDYLIINADTGQQVLVHATNVHAAVPKQEFDEKTGKFKLSETLKRYIESQRGTKKPATKS